MKMRNKGKVYPSPSLPTTNRDSLSVLKLLPAAIFALASLLSLEDKEVLAYLMTRSLKFANPPSILQEKKKNTKKSDTQTHPPLFDCECFACYRSYWLKWNSSPNHELIDQAIDAFEDHLNNGELSRKTRNKKRDKMGPRGTGKIAAESDIPPLDVELETNFVPSLPENTQESGAAASEKGEEEVDTVEKLASPGVGGGCSWYAGGQSQGFRQKGTAGRVGFIQFTFVASLESECLEEREKIVE